MKLIPQDTITRDAYLASFSLNAVLFLFILIIINRLPPIIPLFYSRPWGEEQLIPKLVLFAAPITSLTFLAVNYFLARYRLVEWFSRDEASKAQKGNGLLILRALAFVSVIAGLLAAITVLRIALLVS